MLDIISNVSVNVSILFVCGIVLVLYQWGEKNHNSILKKKRFSHIHSKKQCHSLISHSVEKNARFSLHIEHIRVPAKGFHVKEPAFQELREGRGFNLSTNTITRMIHNRHNTLYILELELKRTENIKKT